MNKERYNRYKNYYTKEYLMGPNAFLLLDELVTKAESAVKGRVLDLGCGHALSSIFIANETKADTVFALDLWINPTENIQRIQKHGLDEKIIPIHGDALRLPFAKDYFDAIISVDSYHYYGCAEGVFDDNILPFVKKGGYVLLAMPGLKYNPTGNELELLKEWAADGDDETFHTMDWWKEHLVKNVSDQIEIDVYEADCYDKAWEDWFATGHEFGLRDKKYLDKGLYNLLNFVMVCIRKK